MDNQVSIFVNQISIINLIEIFKEKSNGIVTFLDGQSCFETGPVMPND